jgi:hypothetical protein
MLEWKHGAKQDDCNELHELSEPIPLRVSVVDKELPHDRPRARKDHEISIGLWAMDFEVAGLFTQNVQLQRHDRLAVQRKERIE